MTERQRLCKILHLWLKDYQKFYLNNVNNPEYKDSKKNISRDFKTTQKVLECLRKGRGYIFYETYDSDLDIVQYIIETSGRDTWRKNDNQDFEISLNHYQYHKYNDKLLREKKLERILKYFFIQKY